MPKSIFAPSNFAKHSPLFPEHDRFIPLYEQLASANRKDAMIVCEHFLADARRELYTEAGAYIPGAREEDRICKALFGHKNTRPPDDDHGTAVVNRLGIIAYLSQPYGFDVGKVYRFAEQHNLDVCIYAPYGTWLPGATTPIVYTLKGQHFCPWPSDIPSSTAFEKGLVGTA